MDQLFSLGMLKEHQDGLEGGMSESESCLGSELNAEKDPACYSLLNVGPFYAWNQYILKQSQVLNFLPQLQCAGSVICVVICQMLKMLH